MHRVISAIQAKQIFFAEHAFFGYLLDPGRSPRARLSFFPCLAHLVVALGTLERHALGVAPRGADWWYEHTPFGPWDDEPTAEVDMRVSWYLQDAVALGLPCPARELDWLRFWCDDPMRLSRALPIRLAALLARAGAVERRILVWSIGAIDTVMSDAIAAVATELRSAPGAASLRCGTSLRFRLQGCDSLPISDESVRDIDLGDAGLLTCHGLVYETFGLFEDWAGELLRYAKACERSDPPELPPSSPRAVRAHNKNGLRRVSPP